MEVKGGKGTVAQSFGQYLILNLKRFDEDGTMDQTSCTYESKMDMLKYLDPIFYNPTQGYHGLPYKLIGVIIHDMVDDITSGSYSAYCLREATQTVDEEQLEENTKMREVENQEVFD